MKPVDQSSATTQLSDQSASINQSTEVASASNTPDLVNCTSINSNHYDQPIIRPSINQSVPTKHSINQSVPIKHSINQSVPTKHSINQSELTKSSINQSVPTKHSINQSELTKQRINQSVSTKHSDNQSVSSMLSNDQSESSRHSNDQLETLSEHANKILSSMTFQSNDPNKVLWDFNTGLRHRRGTSMIPLPGNKTSDTELRLATAQIESSKEKILLAKPSVGIPKQPGDSLHYQMSQNTEKHFEKPFKLVSYLMDTEGEDSCSAVSETPVLRTESMMKNKANTVTEVTSDHVTSSIANGNSAARVSATFDVTTEVEQLNLDPEETSDLEISYNLTSIDLDVTQQLQRLVKATREGARTVGKKNKTPPSHRTGFSRNLPSPRSASIRKEVNVSLQPPKQKSFAKTLPQPSSLKPNTAASAQFRGTYPDTSNLSAPRHGAKAIPHQPPPKPPHQPPPKPPHQPPPKPPQGIPLVKPYSSETQTRSVNISEQDGVTVGVPTSLRSHSSARQAYDALNKSIDTTRLTKIKSASHRSDVRQNCLEQKKLTGLSSVEQTRVQNRFPKLAQCQTPSQEVRTTKRLTPVRCQNSPPSTSCSAASPQANVTKSNSDSISSQSPLKKSGSEEVFLSQKPDSSLKTEKDGKNIENKTFSEAHSCTYLFHQYSVWSIRKMHRLWRKLTEACRISSRLSFTPTDSLHQEGISSDHRSTTSTGVTDESNTDSISMSQFEDGKPIPETIVKSLMKKIGRKIDIVAKKLERKGEKSKSEAIVKANDIYHNLVSLVTNGQEGVITDTDYNENELTQLMTKVACSLLSLCVYLKQPTQPPVVSCSQTTEVSPASSSLSDCGSTRHYFQPAKQSRFKCRPAERQDTKKGREKKLETKKKAMPLPTKLHRLPSNQKTKLKTGREKAFVELSSPREGYEKILSGILKNSPRRLQNFNVRVQRSPQYYRRQKEAGRVKKALSSNLRESVVLKPRRSGTTNMAAIPTTPTDTCKKVGARPRKIY
ncbi:hypothetical protein EB796_006927 [Bugula neritina]|uniref:Uncharacterized protein n=1 Tax=Bugula neritina TaxID=10212 RepID=A0A7J7K9Y2_BUGNE|nr:hypothetical protein EB796_006927 [Bugula neritina]